MSGGSDEIELRHENDGPIAHMLSIHEQSGRRHRRAKYQEKRDWLSNQSAI